MPEDISVQILTQTNENIQQLFNLSSRIDEKVKAVKEQQEMIEQLQSEKELLEDKLDLLASELSVIKALLSQATISLQDEDVVVSRDE